MKYVRKVKVTHEFIQNAEISDIEVFLKNLLENSLLFEVPGSILEDSIEFKKIDTLNAPYDFGWLNMEDPADQIYFWELQQQHLNEYLVTVDILTLC